MRYQRLKRANGSDRDHSTASSSRSNVVRQQPILHQLQHAIGNRAVGQTIQAKLKVSEPGDVHEAEADRVADEVMRMPEPAPSREATSESQPATQIHADGQSLSASARAYFEPRFGHDFSHVRIHTDQSAAEAAESVSARAYTLGSDIVFGAGEFAPETTEGKRVLTHELVHVVQQGGASQKISASGGRDINQSLPSSGNEMHLQRIPKDPTDAPFDGEIIPWSAALRAKPKGTADVVADLPRGHHVTVLGGTAWIFVRTHIGNLDRVGFISHELIKKTGTALPSSFETDAGDPISIGGALPVPTLTYETEWMKKQGLDTKVKRVPNSATSAYNCHGFVYLNAGGWLNDPAPIIKDNKYVVPDKPNVGDAVVYTKATPALDSDRHPTFSETPPHSGLVTKGSSGTANEVTSKWGSWHVYQHKPDDVWTGYGIPTFLRSTRAGGHTAKETP